MIDPAEAVATILADANVGDLLSAETNDHPPFKIAAGALPPLVDTVILVNHTGGIPPMPHLALDQPSIQVMVRGAKNGYQAAKTKIMACKDVLLGMSPITVGTTVTPPYAGDVYRSCIMISDIAYLGQDDNTRPLFSANFRFIVEPVPSGNRVAIA